MSFYITKLRSDRSPVIGNRSVSDQPVNGYRSVKLLGGLVQGLYSVFVKEAITPPERKMSVQSHPWVFNVRRGNLHTTGQAAFGPG